MSLPSLSLVIRDDSMLQSLSGGVVCVRGKTKKKVYGVTSVNYAKPTILPCSSIYTVGFEGGSF